MTTNSTQSPSELRERIANWREMPRICEAVDLIADLDTYLASQQQAKPAELVEAWAKRAGTVEVTSSDELPHLKIYFDNKADMWAFGDTIRQALKDKDNAG